MSMAALAQLATEARSEFETIGDELGVGLCCFALAHVHHNACRWQERHEALELAYLHAERARDANLRDRTLLWMAAGPVHGPMPTDEGLRWFEATRRRARGRAVCGRHAGCGRSDGRELRDGASTGSRRTEATGRARPGAPAWRDRVARDRDRNAGRRSRCRGARGHRKLPGSAGDRRTRLALDPCRPDGTGAPQARSRCRGGALDRCRGRGRRAGRRDHPGLDPAGAGDRCSCVGATGAGPRSSPATPWR